MRARDIVIEVESALASQNSPGFDEIHVSCKFCNWETTVDNYTDLLAELYTCCHSFYDISIEAKPELRNIDVTITV